MDKLSKTVEMDRASDEVVVAKHFQPVVRSICLKLQQQKMVGRLIKFGVQDADTGWQGCEYEFDVWRYDALIRQAELSLAMGFDWKSAVAVHVSVSELVPASSIQYLGTPDLVGGL